MPDIERIIRDCEIKQHELPLSTNAYDMFMRGHLTAEQYQQVSAGEEIRMAEEMKESRKGSILLTPDGEIPEDFHIPKALETNLRRQYSTLEGVNLTKVTERCAKTIDKILDLTVPNQIDHVIIITKRKKKLEVSMDGPRYKIHIKLMDVKKETAQLIGTDVLIPYEYCTTTDDELFWKHFEEIIFKQFQTIVLQIIRAIKTDTLSKIGL